MAIFRFSRLWQSLIVVSAILTACHETPEPPRSTRRALCEQASGDSEKYDLTSDNPLISEFNAQDCLHRRAYQIGRVDAGLGETALAVIGGCAVLIEAAAAKSGRNEAFYEHIAAFRVAQAREGYCRESDLQGDKK